MENKYIRHFKTITKHKLLVMKLCFKCGIPLRGLLHDNSKFGITEFFTSGKYANGKRSPIEIEKEEKGYSLVWQHHKGHNPHHWEYWIDNVGTRENKALPIPTNIVVEMICDWLSAGIVYSGNKVNYNKPYKEPLEYYNRFKDERIFESRTKELIETLLTMIADKGINYFCRDWRKGCKK